VIAVTSLSVEAIRRRLTAGTVGRHLYVFAEVESTNATLRRLAREGAVEGTVVLADSQTAGRGRMGRPWFSPPGVNLYASVLFRPTFAAREAGRFGLIAGLAVSDAIRELGLYPAIKWPNDVLVGGRKVAGSLAECALASGRVDFLLLGVGVNLNVSDEDLAAGLGPAAAGATSLAAATGRQVDRNAFAASYLSHVDAWARRWAQQGVDAVLQAWHQRDILTDRHVEVRGAQGSFAGRVQGLDAEGLLVVVDETGQRRTVTSEEIRPLD
jgi:BirA family biotin operon repressor/biotin-[acetyl-CoA-carboxylase] ligase